MWPRKKNTKLQITANTLLLGPDIFDIEAVASFVYNLKFEYFCSNATVNLMRSLGLLGRVVNVFCWKDVAQILEKSLLLSSNQIIQYKHG
jgi:hypothetical protein